MPRSRLAVALILTVTLTSACGSSAKERTTPTTSSGASTSTTTSTSTAAPTTTPPPASKSRALYPSYLPDGATPGRLSIYRLTNLDSGYTQSYYGEPNADGKLAELSISERPGRLGEALKPGTFAGRNVMIWRSNSATNPVIAVTTTVSGRDVTLVSYALAEHDLAAVLDGLQPRASGHGWNTGALPAGLRLFGEGDQTPEPSDVYYLLKFGPSDVPAVQVSVRPGSLLPEDTCICNPGMRRSLRASTVNGTPAVVIDRSDADAIPSFEVDWQYAPDIVAGVTVHDLDESTALRVASSLTAADPATWRALPCVNEGQTCSPEQVVPAS